MINVSQLATGPDSAAEKTITVGNSSIFLRMCCMALGVKATIKFKWINLKLTWVEEITFLEDSN